jgi:Protein of unknown function (DUF1326)
MTTTEREAATDVVYDLEGTLLEACSCGVLCPCWVGSDPDGGTCDSFNAYHFDRGTIRGVDVSGLSFINVCHIPGNVLVPGSWQVVSFVDDRANETQYEAILDAYHGRLGGPLADLAGLGRGPRPGAAGRPPPRLAAAVPDRPAVRAATALRAGLSRGRRPRRRGRLPPCRRSRRGPRPRPGRAPCPAAGG